MKSISAAGVDIPVLGFGVWQLDSADCARMVVEALAIGYRHIDAAAIYGNETEVGEGLRASATPRDKIFLTTKIWRENMAAGDLQRAAEDSLRRLNQDYVDLLLLHWPNDEIPLAESIGALVEVRRRGLARAIGVANFPSALFEQAQALSGGTLATDQVEFHPFLSQRPVLETVRRHHAALTAYSPLARGAVAREPALIEIGQAHRVGPAQVALRWLIQHEGVVAIPKSGSAERARQNFDIWGFHLSDAEMARISDLARPNGRLISPDWGPAWDTA